MPTQLEVRMFGQPHFSGGLNEVTGKLRALLCFIVLFKHKNHSRDSLAGEFWKDRPEEQARSCLSTAVWRLKGSICQSVTDGASLLVQQNNGDIGFNLDIAYWHDVEEFEALSKQLKTEGHSEPLRANIVRLVNNTQGPLLEGFYEDWAVRERARLGILQERMLEYLMRSHFEDANFNEAEVFGRMLLDEDPLREDIHCALMRVYSSWGRPHLCRRQFDECVSVVDAELSVAPQQETVDEFERLTGEATSFVGSIGKLDHKSGIDDDVACTLHDVKDQLSTLVKTVERLLDR